MKQYIFGERNGIYIIDLQKTLRLFKEATQFVTDLAAQGKIILFVGTKRQAQDAIAEEARRCNMFYVNQRWLGGLLTNFSTIQKSIKRLKELDAMATDGRYELLPKKEVTRLERERKALEKNLSGIKNMPGCPTRFSSSIPRTKRSPSPKRGVWAFPVIAIVDTNCDPGFRRLCDSRQRRCACARSGSSLRRFRNRSSKARPRCANAASCRKQARRTKPKSRRSATEGGVRANGLARSESNPLREGSVETPSEASNRCKSNVRDPGSAPKVWTAVAAAIFVSQRLRIHGNYRHRCQRTPGEDRRRNDGLQERARSKSKGDMERPSSFCEKRARLPPEESHAHRRRRHDRTLHSCRRKTRRSRRSELRNGFRGAQRRFPALVKDIAMHIAAQNPLYVRREEVPAEELEARRREIYKDQARALESPRHIIDKIAEGKLGVVLPDGLSVRSAVREGSDNRPSNS